MKLDFHYFTVKTIASRLGFREQEAQLIATACQFINDNHQDAVQYLSKDKVSEAIIKRGLCQDDPSRGAQMYRIPLLLTAFEKDKIPEAIKSKKNQKDILIPFYYYPDSVVEDEPDYRVTPIQTLQSNKPFSLLFQRAKDRYRSNSDDEVLAPAAIQALRRLGILLHIASDSFAYVPFNGYLSDVNLWTISEVKDTRTFKNITDRYEPQKYAAYPKVGKYRTGEVCDDYNVQFILTVDKSPVSYTRINNDCFAKAARAVYGFLSYFRGKEPSEQEWRDNILPTLIKGWNTDDHSYEDLKQHWSSLTGLNYDYDEDAVRQSIIDFDINLKPDQQGYFDFLLMIQDVRDAVMGKLEKEGHMLNAEERSTDPVACEVSDPDFCGDRYELTITASMPTKLASLGMLVSIFDADTLEQIASFPYTYKNIKTIMEKVSLNIPEQNQNLLAQIDFTWRDDKSSKKKQFKKEYSITGNAAIIEKQQLEEPRSKTGRPVIQIVNGSESESVDYNYPLNAMYISQEGNAQLDLYAPIDLQWKLADGFNMLDYEDLSISMTLPSGQTFKYCNNSKFISLKTDQATGIIHLKAIEEWKNRISVKEFSASIARMKLEISVTLEVSSEKESGYRNIVVDSGNDDISIEYLWNL
ncbi:hypothetical protein RJP21_26730 [Paenibacillus sp. VCA1]|uniref:DUF6765 family protein n=1 Tax=Paenibacillus sp. VCA1 TaxID=3039148 RepID=UPI0028724660|nr:DUF6765 family protein [Paenibacillus sp. VCA1]MDR9857198.1 hypothetical protein [Paenibacillus sp. VCA1]